MEENLHRRKKKKFGIGKIIITILLFIIVISLVLIGYFFYKLNQLDSEVHKPLEREKSELREKPVTTKDNDSISVAVFGVDSDADRDATGGGERSDSIILLSINPKDKKTIMVSVPRDTRAEIVGNDTIEKINHAYAYGGPQMAVDSLEKLMNVPIDHYVSINMDGVKDLINTVGGVEVKSNATFTVKGNSYVEGETYEMDGEEALSFMRSRYDEGSGGDFGRQNRQQIVLEALVNKMARVGSIGRVNDIFKTLGSNLYTDVKMSQIDELMLEYLPARKNMEKYQLEGEGDTLEDGLWYFLPYEDSINEISAKYRKNLELE